MRKRIPKQDNRRTTYGALSPQISLHIKNEEKRITQIRSLSTLRA